MSSETRSGGGINQPLTTKDKFKKHLTRRPTLPKVSYRPNLL